MSGGSCFSGSIVLKLQILNRALSNAVRYQTFHTLTTYNIPPTTPMFKLHHAPETHPRGLPNKRHVIAGSDGNTHIELESAVQQACCAKKIQQHINHVPLVALSAISGSGNRSRNLQSSLSTTCWFANAPMHQLLHGELAFTASWLPRWFNTFIRLRYGKRYVSQRYVSMSTLCLTALGLFAASNAFQTDFQTGLAAQAPAET